MRWEIDLILVRRGLIKARLHPRLRRAVYDLADRRLLTKAFPGVAIRASDRNDIDVRIRAASA